MYSSMVLRIDIDRVLFTLFCLYAFSLPFELVLEILFKIRTIFKPFRILSLLILATYGIKVLKQGFYLNRSEQADWLLYAVFIYGLFISCWRIVTGIFDVGLFRNDVLLVGLNVLTFFIYKTLTISKEQALTLFNYFILGIISNSLYTFYTFIFRIQYGRLSGFTDNPNYAALALVAVITFLTLRTNYNRKIGYQLLYALCVLFLIYIFIITGSRTGFLMFIAANFFIFLFSTVRRKLMLLLVSGVVVLLLLPQQLEKISFGGPLILIRRVSRSATSDTEDVRFIIWRGIFRLLEEQGYAGIGIGQFKANFPRYFGEESHKLILEIVNRGYYLSPHNDYLAILVDYGLPSLLCYLLFLGVTFSSLSKRMLYITRHEEVDFLRKLCFILFICLIIFGLTAENFQHPLFWFLLMFSTKE